MSYDVIGEDDLLREIVSGLGTTELVGDDYGDDDVGEIGATRRRRSSGKGGFQLGQRKLTRARRMAIGFGPTVIATTVTADVTTRPQVVFRPERLFIPSSIAFDFRVVDVRIGQRSQLVAAGALPGAIFSEVSVDVFTHWDTAEVGNEVVLTVTNTAAANRTFEAAMLGGAALP